MSVGIEKDFRLRGLIKLETVRVTFLVRDTLYSYVVSIIVDSWHHSNQSITQQG